MANTPPAEVPRTMAGFEIGLGERAQPMVHPFMFGAPNGGGENYVFRNEDGSGSGNLVGQGWDEGDWARWQSRVGGQGTMGVSTE